MTLPGAILQALALVAYGLTATGTTVAPPRVTMTLTATVGSVIAVTIVDRDEVLYVHVYDSLANLPERRAAFLLPGELEGPQLVDVEVWGDHLRAYARARPLDPMTAVAQASVPGDFAQ